MTVGPPIVDGTSIGLDGELRVDPTSNEDWAKGTLDWQSDNPVDLREELEACGFTVEKFKTLPAYRYALASGNYPWLADL